MIKGEVVIGMVHSIGKKAEIMLLEKPSKNANDYIVKVKESGVVCHAIFNPFSGLFYADDLYAVIENYEVGV